MSDLKKNIDELLVEQQFHKNSIKTEPLYGKQDSNTVEGPELNISVPREEQRTALKTSPYSRQLVVKVQELIQKLTNLPTSRSGNPDGKWGPMSAKAWNVLAEKFNPSPTGPFIVSSVNENGREFPRLDEIKYVLTHPVLQKEKVEEMPKDIIPDVKINRASETHYKKASADEHIFIMNFYQGTPTKEQYENMLNKLKSIKAMNQEQPLVKQSDVELANKVILELISLANDLENMGQRKSAQQIDNQISLYKSAFDELYDLNKGKKSLIEEAHPQGGFVLVPSKDESGKIETVIEEQKKIIEQLSKKPDGKYASLISNLAKMANYLEDSGNIEASRDVDKTIKSLYDKIPFVNRNLVFEATNSYDKCASIKKQSTNKELDKYIKVWDVFVNKFDSIGADMMNWSAPVETFYSEGKQLRKAYRDVSNKIYETSNLWNIGKLNKQSLSKILNDMAKTLNIANADEGIKNMFTFGVDKITQIHYELISDLKLFSNKVASDVTSDESVSNENNPARLYQQSLVKLQQLLNNSSSDKLFKILGNGDRKSGRYKIIELDKWITEELSKKYSPLEAGIKNDELYNSIINPLKTYGVVIASLKSKNIDKAAATPFSIKPYSGNNATQPGGPTVKSNNPAQTAIKRKPQVKSNPKVRESNPKIQKLQEVLTSVTRRQTSKSGKPDGVWGPMSAEAWNTFKNFMADAELSPASISVIPADDEVDRAIRFGLNYLTESNDKISFVLDGQEIYSNDLSSVNNLLAMLNRNFGLNREQMHDDKYKIEVFNYLRKIVEVLQGEQGKKIKLYHGMEAFNTLKNNLIHLWQNISEYGLKDKPSQLDEIGVEKSQNNEKQTNSLNGIEKIEPNAEKTSLQNVDNVVKKIYAKYKALPVAQFFSTKDIFLQLAESKMPGKGTQIEIGRLYYNKLKKDVRDIIADLTEYQSAIVEEKPPVVYLMNYPGRGLGFYKDMVTNISIFDENLNYIARKLGY